MSAPHVYSWAYVEPLTYTNNIQKSELHGLLPSYYLARPKDGAVRGFQHQTMVSNDAISRVKDFSERLIRS
jgi:hypothetical protein